MPFDREKSIVVIMELYDCDIVVRVVTREDTSPGGDTAA